MVEPPAVLEFDEISEPTPTGKTDMPRELSPSFSPSLISRAGACLLALVAWLPTVDLAAQEKGWARFRGPNGSGISETTKVPLEIGPDRNVVWKTALPAGLSSPALSKDSIFLTAGDKEELLTIRLDRKTGKVVWRRKVARARNTKLDKRNHDAAATAAVDDDVVITFFNDFGLVAYDHDGKELWKVPLGPFNNSYGMGASPVLFEDRVFLACDQQLGSYLIAVSKLDGKVLWKIDRPNAASGHSTPIIYRPKEGRPQLIVPGSFLLDAYDTKTGERVWWVSGLSFEMKSVPVIYRDTIYINGFASPMNNPGNQVYLPSFEDALKKFDGNKNGIITKDEMPAGRASAYFEFCDRDLDKKMGRGDWEFMRAALASKNGLLAIKAGGKGDMTAKSVVWSYHRSIPQLPSPLIYGDLLYVLQDQGGLLTTLDPATGKVVTKGRLKDASDNYYASPVAADGKIWFVSRSGLVTVLGKGGSFESLYSCDFDDRCDATPAIADGQIYLRTRSWLYCFGHSDVTEAP